MIKNNSKALRKIIYVSPRELFSPGVDWSLSVDEKKNREEVRYSYHERQTATPYPRHSTEKTSSSTQTLFIFPTYRNYGNYTKKILPDILGKTIYNHLVLQDKDNQ